MFAFESRNLIQATPRYLWVRLKNLCGVIVKVSLQIIREKHCIFDIGTIWNLYLVTKEVMASFLLEHKLSVSVFVRSLLSYLRSQLIDESPFAEAFLEGSIQ